MCLSSSILWGQGKPNEVVPKPLELEVDVLHVHVMLLPVLAARVASRVELAIRWTRSASVPVEDHHLRLELIWVQFENWSFSRTPQTGTSNIPKLNDKRENVDNLGFVCTGVKLLKDLFQRWLQELYTCLPVEPGCFVKTMADGKVQENSPHLFIS